MKSTEVLNPIIPLHLHQEKPEQARESGNTTKGDEIQEKREESGGCNSLAGQTLGKE